MIKQNHNRLAIPKVMICMFEILSEGKEGNGSKREKVL